MQKCIRHSYLCLLLLALIVPSLVSSLPGVSSAMGFGAHTTWVSQTEIHEGHSHFDQSSHGEHQHHDASTHSHETPDRQEPHLLADVSALGLRLPDHPVTYPVRFPDSFERPPKRAS